MRTLIVGAGSAGSVIAARLSEDPRHDVVLIEAGTDYPAGAEHPEALPTDLRDGRHNSMTRHDWGYRYKATDHWLWSARPWAYPRGKVVGGSSAVNTCIALRGQPWDYDEWASMGLAEWAWEHCLPAFKRLETDRDFDNAWHGREGPIPVRRHTAGELVPWQGAFLEACDALGYPRCDDTNDPTTTGAGPHAMNKIDGERMSAARCYLRAEVRARPNLKILSETLVRRVKVTALRAQGLELERHGRVFDLAGDRVVLCAGAIATPGVLLRSGIGPRADVSRLGVELVRDLPAVGARLLDHPGMAVFFEPLQKGFCEISHPLIQTVCRVSSKGTECPNDIQLQPGSFVPLGGSSLKVVTLALCVGKPMGSGTIRYTSSRVDAAPELRTSLLTHPSDRAMAAEAMAHLARLSETRAIRSVAKLVYPSRRPFDENHALRSAMEQITGSGYHPCGTVPMGADGDPKAATDGRGRVRGVKGLYVADASLMPTVTSSNTNLPSLMIGERFGAWLRAME